MNATLVPLTGEQEKRFEWLGAPYLKKVVGALETIETGSARFVGGCVRDSFLGAEPKDFDVATPLTPDVVLKALKAAGLGAAPTGIAHGTVTAIADHQGVEVTTLRADVSTDGRRATVAFTKDWATDAGRRDFRINAIYLTPDGDLYDPVGGLADIAVKKVRFIGDSEQRIREDFLRILRFFRFTARISEGFDKAGLSACAKLKDGIGRLSAERVGAETMAILALPRAAMALEAMKECGVLEKIWETPPAIEAVARIKEIAPEIGAPTVLATLFGKEGDGVSRRLRLSNAEKAIRSNALKGAGRIVRGLTDRQARALIYRLGRDIFNDAIAISCARRDIDHKEYQKLLHLADSWPPPALPVSGRHVLEAGVPAGPAVAKVLSDAEQQWIEEDFPPGDRILEIVRKHAADL